MKTTRENFYANKKSLAFIADVAGRIEADLDDHTAWFDNYRIKQAERIAFDCEIVESLTGGKGKVVDLASVPLLLVAALTDKGFDVTGVDIEPARFARSIERLGLDVRRCDIERETLPFEDGSVDLVVFTEIFEHLRIDPIRTFEEIGRILKPGGTLFMSTPNGLSFRHWKRMILRGRVGPPIYPEYEKLRSIGHMGHVREYAVTDVVEFLKRMGFSIREVRLRGRYRAVPLNWLCAAFPRLCPSFAVIADKTG